MIMSDETKHSVPSDMEYQYADENTGQESLEEPAQKRSPLRMLQERLSQRLPKSRKFRVLLFLVIGVYLAYTFLSVGGKNKAVPYKHQAAAETELTNLKQPTQVAAQPAIVPPPTTQPLSTVAQTQALPSAFSVPAQKDLNFDNAPVKTQTQTTSSVDNTQLKDMATKLNQLSNSVDTLQASLFSLADSAVRLSNKVTQLEKITQAEKKKPALNPLPVFYVQSVVSGRAWIYSPAGDFMTVKLGDDIPGYGQVKKIDARKGVILTTSDRQIVYGANDS